MTFFDVQKFASLAVIALVSACAAPPASRVILLPQADGRGSAVEVVAQAGRQLIDQPYQSAEVSTDGTVKLLQLDAEAVMAQHKQLLDMGPASAVRHTLYFAPGGANLTAESERLLPTILEQAKLMSGGEVFITGHTDSVGQLEANDKLSLQRAMAIRDRLIAIGLKPDLVYAIGRGKRELLVPTADEVNEPRNRRAEVEIR
jgi:OmpA-OmpF porin, OOP family